MRDLLLTGILAILLVQALRFTWVGALLWTWLSLMNPHRLTYGFAHNLPWAQMTAIATLASILWNRKRLRLPPDPAVVLLILFVLWTGITTVFAILPEQSSTTLLTVVKIQLMTLVCIAALRERKHIELFIWVNVLSVGFYGLKGGIFAILSGGGARVWGPAGSYIEDNNALGLAIVMIIPLGVFLRQISTQRWVRFGLLGFLLLCAVAVLSTQSRGAFIAISAMGIVMWTRTRRKLMPAVALVIAATALLAFMPASWEARMQSIGNYQQDSSAMSRINAWHTAVNIANDRVTGGGFAIATKSVFDRYSPNPDWVFTAHSIYFQALGEQGWIGLGLFLAMGFVSFRTAASIRRLAAQRPETMWVHDLAGMVQVSMVGYAVGGAFLSLAYFDLPYNILVALVACKWWLREERWKSETQGAFGSTSIEAAKQARQAELGVLSARLR